MEKRPAETYHQRWRVFSNVCVGQSLRAAQSPKGR
jgi:hypothetical protein